MDVIEYIKRFDDLDQEDTPVMVEVETPHASHQAFCFAMGVEEEQNLKFIVLGGNDSSLQAIRGLISIKTNKLSIGKAEKKSTGYALTWRKRSVKIRDRFQFITTSNNEGKKIIIGFAESLKKDYIFSINKEPGRLLQEYLQSSPFGLPILDNWGDPIYRYMQENKLLENLSIYYDENEFEQIHIAKVKLTEEESIPFLSKLITDKVVEFPEGKGDGSALKDYESLTDYLPKFSDVMLKDITEKDKPLHNPMTEPALPILNDYPRELFPTQKHVVTGAVKALKSQRGLILQGEMSVGKTTLLTATVDAYFRNKGKQGYRAFMMVPPTLTKQWAYEEIPALLPDADVFIITKTEELIRHHQKWIAAGRPKPTKPTFFVVSFETMKSSSTLYAPYEFQNKMYMPDSEKAKDPKEKKTKRVYKKGFYCPHCGERLVTVKGIKKYDEVENPRTGKIKKVLRLDNTTPITSMSSKTLQNKQCIHCGEPLWTYKLRTKRSNYKDWTTYEKKLIDAIHQGPEALEQVELKERFTKPEKRNDGRAYRKLAAIEYIRRKMNDGYIMFSCVDEVHMAKSGTTSVGNSVASLLKVSKKFMCATGTLFGGKAEDVFYTLYRTFPHKMVQMGFKYTDKTKWNETYGNIERTIYTSPDSVSFNKASRNGLENGERSKVVPGISPYVFSEFLLSTTINVRLKDVWPNPVKLHNVPTIQAPIGEDMKENYELLKSTFEGAIDRYRCTPEQGQVWLRYVQTAVSYMDNPFTYPTVTMKESDGTEVVLFEPPHINPDILLPKERKLQEIVEREVSEDRPTIIFVNDTGTTNPERDLQPRLKHVVEQVKGAKAAILRSSTTDINNRTKWLREQVNNGVNVIICSMELVKVGLNLLFTPTIVFYQFSWSLFTLNQAARRHWRIGQTRECRTFYLSTEETMQEYLATIVAKKNQSSEALSGECSSDGLNALLGDSGDLTSMLIKGVKNNQNLHGTTEEWSKLASEETLRILNNIGKKVEVQSVKKVNVDDLFTVPSDIFDIFTPETNNSIFDIPSNEWGNALFNEGKIFDSVGLFDTPAESHQKFESNSKGVEYNDEFQLALAI